MQTTRLAPSAPSLLVHTWAHLHHRHSRPSAFSKHSAKLTNLFSERGRQCCPQCSGMNWSGLFHIRGEPYRTCTVGWHNPHRGPGVSISQEVSPRGVTSHAFSSCVPMLRDSRATASSPTQPRASSGSHPLRKPQVSKWPATRTLPSPPVIPHH